MLLRKKKTAVLLALACACALLSACQSAPSGDAASSGSASAAQSAVSAPQEQSSALSDETLSSLPASSAASAVQSSAANSTTPASRPASASSAAASRPSVSKAQTPSSAPHTHAWSDWTTTIAATTQAPGEEQRTCSGCGAVDRRSIPKLPMDNAAKQQEVFRLVNEERAKNGLSPLRYCSEAQAAADLRAKELVQKFSHDRPDGSSCFTVFDELGITGLFMSGENIAGGYGTPQAVMNGWMNSQGHRENILRASGTTGIVVGVYQNYWVQIFVND